MNANRYYSPHVRPFGLDWKPVTILDPKHLKWIRKQPCVVNERYMADTVAHHVQRKAQGVNDFMTVPLYHTLHDELHTGGAETFEQKYGVDLKDALIAKLVERIMVLEGRIQDD